MRKSEPSPISGKDFIALNHGSLIADKEFMVDILESLYKELKEQAVSPSEGARILLTGSTLAMGDYRVPDMVEEAGGSIVIEEFAEGIRPYWENVSANGNLGTT